MVVKFTIFLLMVQEKEPVSMTGEKDITWYIKWWHCRLHYHPKQGNHRQQTVPQVGNLLPLYTNILEMVQDTVTVEQ